jgi:hypothetical protein
MREHVGFTYHFPPKWVGGGKCYGIIKYNSQKPNKAYYSGDQFTTAG